MKKIGDFGARNHTWGGECEVGRRFRECCVAGRWCLEEDPG